MHAACPEAGYADEHIKAVILNISYTVNRIFSDNSTAAELVKSRLKNSASHELPLTVKTSPIYTAYGDVPVVRSVNEHIVN